jgi:hypothetical protein
MAGVVHEAPRGLVGLGAELAQRLPQRIAANITDEYNGLEAVVAQGLGYGFSVASRVGQAGGEGVSGIADDQGDTAFRRAGRRRLRRKLSLRRCRTRAVRGDGNQGGTGDCAGLVRAARVVCATSRLARAEGMLGSSFSAWS